MASKALPVPLSAALSASGLWGLRPPGTLLPALKLALAGPPYHRGSGSWVGSFQRGDLAGSLGGLAQKPPLRDRHEERVLYTPQCRRWGAGPILWKSPWPCLPLSAWVMLRSSGECMVPIQLCRMAMAGTEGKLA